MNNADEVISAALDGERVDVASLRAALATAEGRETLAAFVLLRAVAADDDLVPAPLSVHAVARPRASTARAWLLARYRVPAAVAASIAAIAVVLSFWMGATWQSDKASGGSGALQTIAPRSTQASHQQAESPARREMVSSPATTTPAEARYPQGAVAAPCVPGAPAIEGRTVRRTAVAAPNEPPKPTRFLRFVTGVDWLAATGSEL